MANISEPILKIGLVLDDSLDKTGGVQEYMLSIGRWMSHQGHEVHYLVGSTARTDIPNVYSLSRNVGVKFNGNYMSMPLPASRRKIRILMEREQYDVLHIQMPHSPWLAHRIMLAAPKQTAVIGTFHIVAYTKLAAFATKGLAVWTRRSLNRIDKLISVSTAAQDYAHKNFKFPSVVIPNAIDYYRFHQAAPIRRSEGLRVLFLGRLVERKGCRYLLEAVNKLVSSNDNLPSFKVIICGKGQLEAELKTYVKNKELENTVQFVGYVSEDEKPGYYASADIAVFPSTGGESFGIVLVEAMASGRTAVLAGRNSGYSTVMAPKPELLFDPTNIDDLTVKLKKLLTQSSTRKDVAAWGMEYSRNFDTGIVGQAILNVYYQALRKRQ